MQRVTWVDNALLIFLAVAEFVGVFSGTVDLILVNGVLYFLIMYRIVERIRRDNAALRGDRNYEEDAPEKE